MRRGWFLLLILSLGLNAGLLYAIASGRGSAPELSVFQTVVGRQPQPDPRFPGPGPHPPDGPPCPRECSGRLDSVACDRLECLARFLRLDEEQYAEMIRVREEMLPRILAERDEVQRARHAVREEYGKPAVVGPARIRLLVRSLTEAQARLDSLVAETMLQEAALLSVEQRTRYFESMPWRKPGPGPGPPCGRRGPGVRQTLQGDP